MSIEPHRVGADDHRLRLDRYLRRIAPSLSRRAAEALLRGGAVRVNGRPCGPDHFVKRGDRIEVLAPAAPLAPATPAGSEPRLLLRLPGLIAVGKPPGMASVPGGPGRHDDTESPTDLLAWLTRRLETESKSETGAGPTRPTHPPGVIHRLDKGTSGLLLFSLDPRAHRELVLAFRRRRIRKGYLTLVEGRVGDREHRIDLPLARGADGRIHPDPAGLPAQTELRVLHHHRRWSLVLAEPRTGRMHQIRAHLAAIGHPILGDPWYGRPDSRVASPRLWLHAWQLTLPPPLSEALGAPGELHCPLWPDLAHHLGALAPDLAADLRRFRIPQILIEPADS